MVGLVRDGTVIIDRNQLRLLVLIVLSGVCASVLMFWITPYGPGVSPDSTVYLGVARSLLSGDGFYAASQPMTHYPPGYPLLLALAGRLLCGDLLQIGRLLGVLLFGVNTALIGIAVALCTDCSLVAMGVAILAFVLSAPMIEVHSMAWSEPPFIMFCLITLILLSLYVARSSSYLLAGASLAAGLAMTTRYIGVVLLSLTVLTPLVFGVQSLKKRLRDAVVASVVAGCPLVLWLTRNLVVAQTATNRIVAVHAFGSDHVRALMGTLHDFALPVPTPYWAKELVIAGVAILFIVGLLALFEENYICRNAHSVRVVLPVLCASFSLAYVVFLVVSISYFDAHIPLDARILSPVFLALTVVGISLSWAVAKRHHSRLMCYVLASLVLLFVGTNGSQAILTAVDLHRNGRGYTSRYWRSSEISAYLKEASDDGKIYSNGADVIGFWFDSEAFTIPYRVSPGTRQVNEDYAEQLHLMCSEVRAGKAIVVYFDAITWRWYLPSLDDLPFDCDLPTQLRLDDGVLYARHSITETEEEAAD
jgi:hypothetical protein